MNLGNQVTAYRELLAEYAAALESLKEMERQADAAADRCKTHRIYVVAVQNAAHNMAAVLRHLGVFPANAAE